MRLAIFDLNVEHIKLRNEWLANLLIAAASYANPRSAEGPALEMHGRIWVRLL